jgi:lipoprotein NlpI
MARRSSRKARPRPTEISPAATPSVPVPLWVTGFRAAIILLTTTWVFWPAMHGDWLWDDDTLIQTNAIVHASDGLSAIWFHPGTQVDFFPLTQTFEWLGWHLWGASTFGFHLLNLGLHIVSALLVWRIFRQLGLRWAWLGGLLFAIHPIVVESVAWMSELKNTLSLPLFLLAVTSWIDFEQRRRPRDYIAALAFFLLAMLAKTTVVMFPFVILLYAWYLRGRVTWRDLRVSAPFFVISIALGIVTLAFLNHHTHEVEVQIGGPLSRLACAGLSLAFYFSKCVVPIGLMPIYPRWLVDPPSLAQFLPWPVLFAVLGFLWTQRRGWGRHALLGLGFFLLLLLPFSGFFPGPYMRMTWVMDHIVYVPVIGLFIAALESLADRAPTQRLFLLGFFMAVAGCFLAGSHLYAGVFIDRLTYWNFAARQNPGAWAADNNIGTELVKAKRFPEGLAYLNLALQLHPNYYEAYADRGELRGLLGDAGAKDDLDRAIALEPEKASPYLDRGVFELAQGQPTDALRDLEQFRKMADHDISMRDYAALWIWIARSQLGDKATADSDLAAALADNWVSAPDSWVAQDARFLLGRLPEKDYLAAAAAVSDPEKAKDQFCEAWYYIGTKRLLDGDKTGAIAAFQFSLATGRIDFFEYVLSRATLQRLVSS